MRWRVETDISGFPVRRSDEATRQFGDAGHWTDETLVDCARAYLRENPDKVLLVEGERKITRAQAWDQALRLARFFQSRGLRPGDVVSFQLPNWSESAIIALATRMCGLVINPIQPIYRDTETGYILGDCRAKLLFAPQVFRNYDYPAMIERLRPGLPELGELVVVRGDGSAESSWEAAMACDPLPESELPGVDPAAVMMVMYTSGTTSKPKGVLHSHQTYGFKLRQMRDNWGLAPSDVFFMPSPVTHITGAFWIFDAPWMCGLTSVLMDVWSSEEAMRIFTRNGCTVNGGATPFLEQLLDAARDDPELLRTLQIFFCGGTTISTELMRRAADAYPDCLFLRAYGCTETPTTSMGAMTLPLDLRIETDGRIFPPTEVKFLHPDRDEEVPAGEEGEIASRGPEQFLGYLHTSDNEGLFDEEGFFRSGDLGRLVHGDCILITGRKKDIIIRSGENISPKEVEDVLNLNPDIVEVAIVAMPSPVTGEKGCAFVIPRDGAIVDLGTIRAFLEKAGIARQKFPEHVVVVDDLPRVPSGKVRKDVLRAEARKIADALLAA